MSPRASLLFIAAMLILFTSCSQSRTGIYKTHSFYKINTPGNIPVDNNGKQIGKIHDTTRIIYFESEKETEPLLKAVIVNGIYYKPVITKIAGNSETAGTLVETNKPVIVNGKPGTQLWKVELGTRIDPLSSSKLKNDEVYLVVEFKDTNAMRIIKKHKELVPELQY
jgi:hypothetical protein